VGRRIWFPCLAPRSGAERSPGAGAALAGARSRAAGPGRAPALLVVLAAARAGVVGPGGVGVLGQGEYAAGARAA
jgi:hypothetical protein